jgi:hypothetical protein
MIGIDGMLKDSMENRTLAFSLLLSVPIWLIAVPILVFISSFMTSLQYQMSIAATTLLLAGSSIGLANYFVNSFKDKFAYVFEEKSVNIVGKLLLYTIMIFLVDVVASVLIFVIWGVPNIS